MVAFSKFAFSTALMFQLSEGVMMQDSKKKFDEEQLAELVNENELNELRSEEEKKYLTDLWKNYIGSNEYVDEKAKLAMSKFWNEEGGLLKKKKEYKECLSAALEALTKALPKMKADIKKGPVTAVSKERIQKLVKVYKKLVWKKKDLKLEAEIAELEIEELEESLAKLQAEEAEQKASQLKNHAADKAAADKAAKLKQLKKEQEYPGVPRQQKHYNHWDLYRNRRIRGAY